MSFGLAFAGCTLPGRSKLLFTVAHGQMCLPRHLSMASRTEPVLPAAKLARALLASLLAERPGETDASLVS